MNVTILLTEQLSLFELACATELFALPRPDFEQWYKTRIVSLTNAYRAGICQTELTCELVDALPPTDLLVIPSFPVKQNRVSAKIAEAILNHYKSGGRIISFCSGVFLLARLGIIDNRAATTHWQYADEFKQQFPHITYKDDVLYHYDGVIGCSAGSAAAIDLGIEVIRQDYGYESANAVARRLVLPAHRNGGQSQFVEKPIAKTKSGISDVLEWAVKNLSPDLTIDQLADKANMTRRTFDRRFRKTHNMSPLEWLIERKLEIVKMLLETTQLSVEAIAPKAGFDNPITLRHHFKKSLSITPTRYREIFVRADT
jgi:AraC family transcriptional activator FtrA